MLLRVRGFKTLVHDAVDFTVDLVQEGHESVARNVMRVVNLVAPGNVPARTADDARRAVIAGTLGAVRFLNRTIERLVDGSLDAAAAARLLDGLDVPSAPVPMRSDVVGSSTWLADAAVGALNGIVGDYLHRGGNGLDLGFSIRYGDQHFAFDHPSALATFQPATRRIAVFVHGLGVTEWSWCWDAAAYHGDAGANFGTLLCRDVGLTPLFVRYNTGRRVSENGRLLADALERLLSAGQGAVDEVVLVGHSMGGLVARSACHFARQSGQAWIRRVSRVICLGSPHQGAPLEKLGDILATTLGSVDHPGTRIPAEILRRRSAGIRDLRRGTFVDDEWLGGDADPTVGPRDGQVPLLDDVTYCFISATVTRDPTHPLGRLLGDVLVRVPSASGPALCEQKFRIETECFGGIVHHQLQNHPDVYAWLREACEGSAQKVCENLRPDDPFDRVP